MCTVDRVQDTELIRMAISMHFMALSIGVAVLVVLVFLAVFAVICFKKQMKKIQHSRETYKRLPSQYSYITPTETPVFTIPPYVTLEDVFEEGDGSSLGSFKEDEENKDSLDESPLSTPTALGTPRISRPQFLRTMSEVPAGYTRDRNRYQYRKSLSLSTQSATIPPHKKAKKRISLSPYGKMQVSIHFETNKNLLVIQVNGMYDLPQLRTSGVSTPYVRVLLMTGNDDKESRTNFMNLSTNRICVFDRISLETVQQSTLKFIVLDYDRFSRSEFVAEILVPLCDINVEEGETITRKLISQEKPDEDGERGQLWVSLCQEPRAGRLLVHIIKAEKLPSFKSEDHLDTYVRVTYYAQKKMVDKRKTKVVKRTTCPVFNEIFSFELKEEELKNSSVKCEVFQSDFIKTDKIGFINLGVDSFGTEIRHWNEMMSSPQKQVIQCHKLHI